MSSTKTLELLESLAADQWGIITTAQAKSEGISRLQLSRLSERGVLTRTRQGLYHLPSASFGPLTDIREAWVALRPSFFPGERLSEENDVFVSHESAAIIHQIGDLIPHKHTFSTRARKQTRHEDILIYNYRNANEEDVLLVDGLPVTSIERTIADLADEKIEFNYLAVIVTDALRKEGVRIAALAECLDASAPAYGYANGQAFIEACQAEARSDEDREEIAHRFATSLAVDLGFKGISTTLAETLEALSKRAGSLAGGSVLQEAHATQTEQINKQIRKVFLQYPGIANLLPSADLPPSNPAAKALRELDLTASAITPKAQATPETEGHQESKGAQQR
ncbi:type IV toxin-antitoxin system AbiEi family antitoxin domain-containing protein [Corynebacterium urealyticum]|uniref:type IV toxin-antitoxin system AbiEi family antitoxin domain-containing protein n=1 Tax=Corynebacterium urealyticum TaxID=43771 RepID=UPI0002B3FB58|nr:type IV toxin-antitoxin system AbiEi family antitoxin domain-containing protein [Corynebacterium urealyticum]AGE35868.1 hypothetical protein CU7111_0272 [Corynebacterium urealyticum DSM 7111]QQB07400.1 type IV toxin-antitoxin system AbiEi family antitoxin domain-containing protein [Corynebacterium urealyticum]QQE50875.1 type IV toxin-antitoxin system AbiEi family antitoxin domain-containing protein [Corynebacterium urealyticum]